MDTASANIRRKKRFKYILITEGIAIGLITGALISVFRLMLTGADALRGRLADYAHTGAGAALVCALVLLAAAVLVALLLGFEPDIAGSGIPQVEAELRGLRDMDWKKVIAGKMAGCAIAIGGGLALGREGPSIQIGAMVGKGFAKARKSVLTEERLLLTCGAGAGLSAAFGAPLAGAIFSLEELHRNFSAEVLMTTMAAAAASDFVTANILGLTPVFGFEIEHGLPLRYYWAVVVLGLALGAFGAAYNKVIELMQDAFTCIGRGAASLVCRAAGREVSILRSSDEVSSLAEKASRFGRMITVFAAAYLFIFIYPDVLGSGSGLVSRVCSGEFAVSALAVLLILKFIFSTASFGSGSPGGIFLPLLVLGAVTGGLFSEALGITGGSGEFITAFVVIGMAGLFSAIVRAPVTGVVLITEMTGDFTTLLPLVLVSLIAYVTAEALGAQPVYTQLLGRVTGRRPDRSRMMSLRERKTIIDAEIHVGSRMDGSSVSEFGLPLGTLIVSVTRGSDEIIPDGHTILRAGDELEILTREKDLDDVEDVIDAACRSLAE